MPIPIKRTGGVASALLTVAGVCSAAPQLDYTLELGAEHSNNINLSENDPISQDLLIPRLYFTFDQVGSTVQAQAIGQVEYRDYLQGDFDNEFRGQLAATFNWVVAPQWLNFAVAENSAVEPVNPLASNAPTNQQQINVFSAGPTLLFHFNDAWRAQADFRYGNTTASTTKYFNSQRGTGAFRLVNEINATDQFSGNLEARHVDFSNPGTGPGQFTPNYNDYSLYGRYQSKLRTVQIDAVLGWVRYVFDRNTPDQSGSLARLKVDWQPTAASTFEVGAARQFTDASEQLVIDPSQIGISVDTSNLNVDSNVITPLIYLQKRVEASYTHLGPRATFTIGSHYEQDRYVNDPLYNQTTPGASLDLQYRLSPLLSLGFAIDAERIRYSTLDRRDNFISYGPTLVDQMTRHWSWQVNLTHNQRRSSATGSSYTENLAFFSISYKR